MPLSRLAKTSPQCRICFTIQRLDIQCRDYVSGSKHTSWVWKELLHPFVGCIYVYISLNTSGSVYLGSFRMSFHGDLLSCMHSYSPQDFLCWSVVFHWQCGSCVSIAWKSLGFKTGKMTSSNAFLVSLATKAVSSFSLHSLWISSSTLIIPTAFWLWTGEVSSEMFTRAWNIVHASRVGHLLQSLFKKLFVERTDDHTANNDVYICTGRASLVSPEQWAETWSFPVRSIA